MNKVILIGYFSETAELCEKCGFEIVGYVDDAEKADYPYLGNDDKFVQNYNRYIDTPLVLTPDNPHVRKKLYDRYSEMGFSFQSVIAPDAIISKTAAISEGCMVQSLCNVSTNTKLGKCVRVNTGANIMHDNVVGDFSVVAPAAVLLGHVKVGEESYVGANSTVLPNITIGNNATIGAGAVVTKSVKDRSVFAGVPARLLKEKEETT